MTLGPTKNFLRAPEVETLVKNSYFCYNFDSTKQPLEGVPISENYCIFVFEGHHPENGYFRKKRKNLQNSQIFKCE